MPLPGSGKIIKTLSFASVQTERTWVEQPVDRLKLVGEMFGRFHTDDEYAGTGMGLALVTKAVALHRGVVVGSVRPCLSRRPRGSVDARHSVRICHRGS